MNAEEFGAWLATQEPALGAWGSFVTDTVQDQVLEAIGTERFASFFKITPKARVKTQKSALAKVVKKKYSDPINQMTDLVGTRFVVLVQTDLGIVEEALGRFTGWIVSKERDPDFEISQEPNVFDYQSFHYLVRSFEDREIKGVFVPSGTTCEVQVRTLLQHAYAELVHDKVYKAEGAVPLETKRLIARSMALMESTDEMFCRALQELEQINTNHETWLNLITQEYRRVVRNDTAVCAEPETTQFLDTYRDLLQLANRTRVFSEAITPRIASRIQRRAADSNGLFSTPMCLLVYWLLKKHPRETVARWPFGNYRTDFETAMAELQIAR